MSQHAKLVVVDDDDNVITYKTWTEVKPTDRVRITAIWLENSKGQVLMAQRSHLKEHQPMLWGPAASGTVESDETYEQNAYKELQEEIGVSGIQLELVAVLKWDGGPTDKRFCATYRAILDWPIEKFRLQEDEVEAIKWIDKDQLLAELQQQPSDYLPNSLLWMKTFRLIG